MKRPKPIALMERAAWAGAVALTLVAGPFSSARAAPTLRQDCVTISKQEVTISKQEVTISKQEYDSARRRYMMRTRFGYYVRTGRLGRRQYLYCQS